MCTSMNIFDRVILLEYLRENDMLSSCRFEIYFLLLFSPCLFLTLLSQKDNVPCDIISSSQCGVYIQKSHSLLIHYAKESIIQ